MYTRCGGECLRAAANVVSVPPGKYARKGETMPARVKLKGIDGGPHKRWSMWFNSMVREEPYLGLTCAGTLRRRGGAETRRRTGAAWLSSARAVRCWVKSRNERNPYCQLHSMKLESLVIAHQHGAVNTFPGLVHTARHTIRVEDTRSR